MDVNPQLVHAGSLLSTKEINSAEPIVACDLVMQMAARGADRKHI
jgi:hypothetical protein